MNIALNHFSRPNKFRACTVSFILLDLEHTHTLTSVIHGNYSFVK